MAAEFVCPRCGCGRRLETGRPGEAVSCPRCGATAPARACSGRAPGAAEERVAPRSGVFDAGAFNAGASDSGAFAASRRASAGPSAPAGGARTVLPGPKPAPLPSAPVPDSDGPDPDGVDEPAPVAGPRKSLFLGLMLTLLFGGFGVFYATFPGGLMCALMELTLFGLSVFFGEKIYPALAFVRLIYFMVTFAAISGHNKDLERAAKRGKRGKQP